METITYYLLAGIWLGTPLLGIILQCILCLANRGKRKFPWYWVLFYLCPFVGTMALVMELALFLPYALICGDEGKLDIWNV